MSTLKVGRARSPIARSASGMVTTATAAAPSGHLARMSADGLGRSVSQPVGMMPMNIPVPNRSGTDIGVTDQRGSSAIFDPNDRLCRSPELVILDDDDSYVAARQDDDTFDGSEGEMRAAKRAKTSGDEFRAVAEDQDAKDVDENIEDSAYRVLPGSPLPSATLPWLPKAAPSAPTRHRAEERTENRGSGMTPPAIATRVPPPRHVLGFSPWSATANHPEDQLTESTVKSGYVDKGPGSGQTETGSARPAIWPVLGQKNHSSLQMLSYLYTQAMEKRLALGKCVAPSTFKPPPRVTVTDNKREAWLRDLANPAMPLRKQSRTIPHGIRGTTLMEQCLSKAVPWQRAVWLAKCVGANEMRAFRRKGIGGAPAAIKESKWVREWTVSVETFFAGIVAACGQADWEANMQYSLRFISSLYSEQLLDRSHFLDWLVHSFASCSLEMLAVWALLLRSFWADIPKYGRRARRLAEATLEFLRHTSGGTTEEYALVRKQLWSVIFALQSSGNGCLLIPKAWEKNKDILASRPTLGMRKQQDSAVLDNIAIRNERLLGSMAKSAVTTRSPLLKVYAVLDAVDVTIDTDKLVTACSNALPNIDQLVSALLDWASTPYRNGSSRIYLTAHIVSQLQQYGAGTDTDSAVLRHLARTSVPAPQVVENIQRVIVELVRLQAFSIGRYLQWLISAHSLATSGQLSLETSIITAVPTEELSAPLKNTIKTMARRLGQLDQPALVSDARLRTLAAIDTTTSSRSESPDVPVNLSLGARLNISRAVCNKIAAMTKAGSISSNSFCAAREYFENVRDFTTLAEVVKLASTIEDSDLLSTIIDTISIHASSFAAMEQLDNLVEGVKEQYTAARQRHALDRTLILSFISLIRRTRRHLTLAKSLAEDLAHCEQQTFLAVCSPASDSLVTMHASSLDSAEQIDAVFASGNTMDEQLMQRIFTRILLWATKCSTTTQSSVNRECDWLNRLRAVEPSGYDKLAKQTLLNYVKGIVDPGVSLQTITTLVLSGTVALSTLAQMAPEVTTPEIASDLLQLFTSEDTLSPKVNSVERHRFWVQQELCRTQHSQWMLTLLRNVCRGDEKSTRPSASYDMVLYYTVARHAESQRCWLELPISDTQRRNSVRLFDRILRGGAKTSRSEVYDKATVVRRATALSIPFCTEFLRLLNLTSGNDAQEEEGFGDAVTQACMEHSEFWPQLLEFAGSAKSKIYTWALRELMPGPGQMAASKDSMDHAARYLAILALLVEDVPASDHLNAINTMDEKLKDHDKLLWSADSDSFAEILTQLHSSLDLVSLFLRTPTNGGEPMQNARSHLLSTLCTLLVHPRLQTRSRTLEHIFDLASILSDSLPEDALESIKRPDAALRVSDPRLDSILGLSGTAKDAWLSVVHQVPAPTAQTQHSRAMSKHGTQPSPLSIQSPATSNWSSQPSQTQPSPSPYPQSSGSPQSPQAARSPAQQQQQQQQSFPTQSGPQSALNHPQPAFQQSMTVQRLRKASLGNIAGPLRQDSRAGPVETKITPFQVLPWELMSDPTPVMGVNDSSLSLTLFGARKV